MLATIPPTVPELPNAYLVRDSDIAALKRTLLSTDGTASSTSLTSKRQKSKTSAHGMGGVGKTTVACALVHDEEILSSFEKVVWVSVGLEPNIRELQDSIYEQVVGMAIPATATSPGLVLKALADGARRSKILLVLDDVWEARHEKSLNCIDNNTSSKLLITTRIRGILNNASEVALGVLPPDDALQLLLSSAGIAAIDEGSEERGRAVEVTEFCGRLPLTLAICGGMVNDVSSAKKARDSSNATIYAYSLLLLRLLDTFCHSSWHSNVCCS